MIIARLSGPPRPNRPDLDELQIDGRDLREDLRALRGRQSPQRAEQAAEDCAVVVENRVVPVLEQRAARAVREALYHGRRFRYVAQAF